MAQEPATNSNPPPIRASFSDAAATDVYKRHNTLVLTSSFFWNAMTIFKDGANIDQDATIKKSSIDVNLEAAREGYKGTAQEQNFAKLENIINKYPEIKSGAAEFLKGEGKNGLNVMQKLMTGNSTFNLDDVDAQLQKNPASRKMLGDALRITGQRDDLPAEYFADFATDALAASKDPSKIGKFRQTAAKAGIDTGKVETQAMWDMLKDATSAQGIVKFLDKMDLPPAWKEGLTGFLVPLVEMYKGFGSDLLYGNKDNPGGLMKPLNKLMDDSIINGRELRNQYGAGAPTPGNP